MKKKRIYLNKPLYLGFSILEISKKLFYAAWYDGYKRLWPGEQSKLLMVDTDSYIFEVTMPKGKSVYEDLYRHRVDPDPLNQLRIDCSGYSADDSDPWIKRLRDMSYAKVLGALKDETGSMIIIEFVGLRPKAYALKIYDRRFPDKECQEILKAKGCPRLVLKYSFNFKTMKDMILMSQPTASTTVRRIRSHNHCLQTVVSSKRCLSIADDKRFIIDSDPTSTLAFGHKKFKQSN
jgi:hypothetical protein